MKVNKIILLGIFFIFLGGTIFLTDILNPVIRPITHIFLMGSSKGKDIMFFGLLGMFLILSQTVKRDINVRKYLKISNILAGILLTSGILLEVLFRLQMGIKLNSVFCSMTNTMSSTSILHTHLLKSIFGHIITSIIGPFIQSDINTGVGLYSYVPSIGLVIILLIPVLFITLTLSMQKRSWIVTILLSYISSCLLIGALDGGMFGTPAIVGICGLYLVYKNEYDINQLFGVIKTDKKPLEINKMFRQIYSDLTSGKLKHLVIKFAPILLIGFFIILRFTIAFAGAEPDYYTVNIENISDDVDFGDIPIEKIDNDTYRVTGDYNEMELINELKIPLNGSCTYYTVSWNIYSYFTVI